MSNLMKAHRLAMGDDHFAWRVEAACWQAGVEFTPAVVRHVAADEDILAAALMDDLGTIDSSPVSDEAILSAVQSYNN
jgi:2C-methyl-D-erythritol 2,4-cyclodiphosphate synthase